MVSQWGPRLLRLFRNHWSVENSLHHVKDRSWDSTPGDFATLVNTGLNALRLEGWFPARISMPLRAKTCAFRPTQTIARLYGQLTGNRVHPQDDCKVRLGFCSS